MLGGPAAADGRLDSVSQSPCDFIYIFSYGPNLDTDPQTCEIRSLHHRAQVYLRQQCRVAARAAAADHDEVAQLRAEIEELRQALQEQVSGVDRNGIRTQLQEAAEPSEATPSEPQPEQGTRKQRQQRQQQQEATQGEEAQQQQKDQPADRRQRRQQQQQAQSAADLEAGILWPNPVEDPPFWDRPARSSPVAPGLCFSWPCPRNTMRASARPSVILCGRQPDGCQQKGTDCIAGGPPPQAEQDADPLHIVHVTAEMAPIAKVTQSCK